MDFERLTRGVRLAPILCCALLCPAGTPLAASFPEFVDPNPAPGNQFGAAVLPLSTGNVVITSPSDDAGGVDAGAVYLFNGSTGALISTLRGSTAGDQIGSSGATALTNGNYVVRSPLWDNAGAADAGAVTWGSGTSGMSGVVSSSNSLVGSTAGDQIGGTGVIPLTNGNYVVLSLGWHNGGAGNAGAVTWRSGLGSAGVVSAANSLVGSTVNDNVGTNGVTALSNGNYVVVSSGWDNGAVVDVGAVTWGSGTSGVSGAVSVANSLVGSTVNDNVGANGMTVLTNGNYVFRSSIWNNGAVVDAGAVTWGSGTSASVGVVSAANSLVGSTASDQIGIVTALSNGNYVVASSNWDNGAVVNAGAATWGSGTSGVSGVITAANSLVGSTASDQVGVVTALSNGSYVVTSGNWDNGAVANAGAATWGSGASGVSGAVSAANSLVGSAASDNIGGSGVTVLTNGSYVVRSPNWDNGAAANAGAATWGSGASGVSGAVSAANSLVGSTSGDQVGNGSSGVAALSNGNYVVTAQGWDNGAVANVGAATWGSGTSGVSGAVSAANSLVGSTSNDNVGVLGVMVLTNGNYVVRSVNWDNGAAANAGAATWGSGTSGVSGPVSAANSLVGSATNDNVGATGVTALTNGNYVVRSPNWDNGAVANAGAATWGSGTSGVVGVVSAANSLVGSTTNDLVSANTVTPLTNGNYVVNTLTWHNGAIVDAGAVTWGGGTSGVSGVVSAANSLVGSSASDFAGANGVTALSDGNYVVNSGSWDNGAIGNAGAATWGNGTSGVSGVISASNSLFGLTTNTQLQTIIVDNVNNTFIARFTAEAGGRVRVGPGIIAPVILSAVDIPTDQGGWLYLTFNRSHWDHAIGSFPVATYGVWRHVPGTIPARAVKTDPAAAHGAPSDGATTERLRTAIPPGLDVQEVDGRFYVTSHGSQPPEVTAAFPLGTWALISSVPALQQDQYVVVAPTTSNAAPNDFVVTAHTATPSLWFLSESVSGQSVDNLAPAPPASLTASYVGGHTNLQWAANTEHDLGSYHVYRGTSAGFTPAPGNQIASVTSPSYADVGPAGGYYKVSALDVNGNESGFTLITPGGTTDVDAGIPIAFALEGVWPNPTNGDGLHVAFALPNGAAARIQLLDVSGRRVIEREVGSLGAGRHRLNLAERRRVAPGLYWVRLAQGPNQQTARVAVIE